MNLTKEQRTKLVNNFKRFVEDIKKYDIICDITIPINIRFSNKNNRYDYVKVYKNKEVFGLGEDFNKFIKDLENELQQTWYCSYKYDKILDIMNNRDMIFAELEKENNKNKDILNDILNY